MKQSTPPKSRIQLMLHQIGWVMFVFSSVGFMLSSWNHRDWWAFAASVLFFVACWFFLFGDWYAARKQE